MKANLNLGRVFGIKILVHWTFSILIVLVIISELKQHGSINDILFNIALVLAIFTCVILHELGHAITARRFGIETKKITLLPIGGVANLERIPESPKQELLITIAGPMVNILIAAILHLIIPVNALMQLNFTETFETFNSLTLTSFLIYLYIVNISLAAFNLIPAFPMDGGRIFRALLAIKMNRVKATQIASNTGQVIAVLFLFIGLLFQPFLIIISLFILIAAYSENKMVRQLALIKGHSVEEAMILDITTFSPEDPVDVVVNKLISGTETNFIVIEDHKIVGVLFYKTIMEHANKNVLVKDIMDVSFKTLKYTDDLEKAFFLIYNENRPFIPVINRKKVVGVIDSKNLNEYIVLQERLAS